MHPRVVLLEADARMLFDNGESLIIAMATEMQRSASDSTQGIFADMFANANEAT